MHLYDILFLWMNGMTKLNCRNTYLLYKNKHFSFFVSSMHINIYNLHWDTLRKIIGKFSYFMFVNTLTFKEI